MAREVRTVDEAVARFDAIAARWDGRTVEAAAAQRRHLGRTAAGIGRRVVFIVGALAALLLAVSLFGLLIQPIGATGLMIAAVAGIAILAGGALWRGAPDRITWDEKAPTGKVIAQLESLLVRARAALPPAMFSRIDSISARLPLLEAKLAEADALDPLAQDARRLMGKHIPDLIDSYAKVPAAWRDAPGGDGLSVDQRLATSLEAADGALADMAERIVADDRRDFETKGRFIEAKYRDLGEG